MKLIHIDLDKDDGEMAPDSFIYFLKSKKRKGVWNLLFRLPLVFKCPLWYDICSDKWITDVWCTPIISIKKTFHNEFEIWYNLNEKLTDQK